MVFYFPVSGTAEAIKLVLPLFKYCHSLLQPWHGRSMEAAEDPSFNNRLLSYPIIFRPTALLGQAYKRKRSCTLTTHRLARPILRLKEV